MMKAALTTTVQTSFEDAVGRTREGLSQNGFGVLTEIDMKATLKAKLGEDMEDYTILGACNPSLAHQAVTAYRQIGVLLPCNVVVRRPRHTGNRQDRKSTRLNSSHVASSYAAFRVNNKRR